MRLRLPSEADVEAARANIAGVVRRTPLWRLDAETPPGVTVWLKLENLQPLGSFKLRAGVNALRSMDPAALRAGVIAPSAGNFGLGLAYAARQLNLPVTIVAPDTAAMAKTDALRALGATVIRIPFEDWWQVLTTRRFDGDGGVFFHPVAMNEVVAGNATIGVEIVEDLDHFDAVVAPVRRRRADQRDWFGDAASAARREGDRRRSRDRWADGCGAGGWRAGAGESLPQLRRRYRQQRRAGGDVATGPPDGRRGGQRPRWMRSQRRSDCWRLGTA